MSPTPNPQYWLNKKAHRKTGFPLATIAYYGPDDKFASKVVVGIIPQEGGAVSSLERWFSVGADVRSDLAITQLILEFIQEQRIERVAMVDRILGCPHEEGVDYPEGESCPQCPFWANSDRWTGKSIS
jgi:hypothetical protein